MFKGKHRSADEGLTELVAEIAGAVGGLDEDLFGRFIEPGPGLHTRFPGTGTPQPRVGGHVDRRAGHGDASPAARHAVADFAAASRGRSVEGLYSGREIVGLGLQGDDRMNIADAEETWNVLRERGELLDIGPLDKGDIVLVSRNEEVGVRLCRFFYERKERFGHFLAVDDKGAVEDLMPAVFRVDLRETEKFAVGQVAPELAAQPGKIINLLRAQGKPLFAVVGRNIGDETHRFRLVMNMEDLLAQSPVQVPEHRVKPLSRPIHRKSYIVNRKFFYPADPADPHILGYLHGVCAPWCHHLAAGADPGSR